MSTSPSDKDWPNYYEITLDRAPCDAVRIALDNFDREAAPDPPRLAVDLGCGGGRDAIEILRRGWAVLAIDAEPAAIEVLTAREDLPSTDRLQTLVSRFEDARWPNADLVNSGFALPLVPQAKFAALWQRIVESLKPGGRFSGQLYGDRDGWVGDPTNSFFTRDQVQRLLDRLEVEHFQEEEVESRTRRGKTKQWHVFHIVARKP